jgi:putative oxidoreductase
MFTLPPIFSDIVLMAVRLMIGAIFLSSGWSHAKDPAGRGQSIGMSKGLTLFLGIAEMAGALGVAVGVWPQLAAAGLILIMLGAIQKKMFAWKTGFWGPHKTDGWSYDLIMVVMNLAVIVTDGGRWVLVR